MNSELSAHYLLAKMILIISELIVPDLEIVDYPAIFPIISYPVIFSLVHVQGLTGLKGIRFFNLIITV